MTIEFKCKETKGIWNGKVSKKFPRNIQDKALVKLRLLDAASRLDDLRVPPSNKLEKKKGSYKDYYAIWINDQWRILFKWDSGKAYDVFIKDYHK